jgi:hypothetical protein
MARLLSVIVEVALQEGERIRIRKAIQRVNDSLLNLVQNKKNESFSIAGERVAAIHCDGIWGELKEPCIVPDFGHNHACKCEHPEPYEVLRLLGVNGFVIDGYPESSQVFGTYEVTPGIQLIVSGMSCCAPLSEPTPLKKLSS